MGQSRGHQLCSSREVLGFALEAGERTLFCAYTIVPSNVPLADCRSHTFSFWTSMPPEETVICNQMDHKQANEKQREDKSRNCPQAHPCMACGLQDLSEHL